MTDAAPTWPPRIGAYQRTCRAYVCFTGYRTLTAEIAFSRLANWS